MTSSRLLVDPSQRLRNIVSRALVGCAYVGSRREESHTLVIDARRSDGTAVHLRFRGVQDSESTAMPESGAALRLAGVGSADKFSFLGLLIPPILRRPSSAWRVTIEAGKARIDVVCQDVEWWEERPGMDRPPESGPTS